MIKEMQMTEKRKEEERLSRESELVERLRELEEQSKDQGNRDSVQRSELQVEFKTKEVEVEELKKQLNSLTKVNDEMKTSLDSKVLELDQSTQDVKNLKMQVVELKTSADQSLAEANQLQVAIDQQKKEMALVTNMQLARDEEVKQLVGGLEKKVSKLSTELDFVTKAKVKCEGENAKLNEKLSHSTKACDEILDQLKDKTDLVETQQIRIENLYSQLTMANASYELLSKEKTNEETALEEQIKDLQGEVNQVNEELDQLKGVMAARQAEHDLEIQTLTEEHQESKNKVVAEAELWHQQLLADAKAEHEQMTLLMENEHKKATSDVVAHHLHELHELKAKAEEKTARVVEQDRLLAERQKLLDQMEALLSEKNGEKEILLKSLSEKDQSLVAAKEEQEQTLAEVRSKIPLKEKEFQARMEEKDRTISEMRGKLEELKKRFTEDIKVAEKTEAELKDIVVDMNKRIEELEQSLEDQDHTYKANIAELEAELGVVRLNLSNMNSSKNEFINQLDQVEQDFLEEKRNSAATIKALEEQLSEAHSSLKLAKSGLEAASKSSAAKFRALEDLLLEKKDTIERLKTEQHSSVTQLNNYAENIRKLEGKLRDAMTKTSLYKSKIEKSSEECLAAIELMEAGKAEASASIREYRKRLEELAKQGYRLKALVLGAAAALSVGLLAYNVK